MHADDMGRLQKRSADTLSEAWDKFENDPTIMTLEGCGIQNSARLAGVSHAKPRNKLLNAESLMRTDAIARW